MRCVQCTEGNRNWIGARHCSACGAYLGENAAGDPLDPAAGVSLRFVRRSGNCTIPLPRVEGRDPADGVRIAAAWKDHALVVLPAGNGYECVHAFPESPPGEEEGEADADEPRTSRILELYPPVWAGPGADQPAYWRTAGLPEPLILDGVSIVPSGDALYAWDIQGSPTADRVRVLSLRGHGCTFVGGAHVHGDGIVALARDEEGVPRIVRCRPARTLTSRDDETGLIRLAEDAWAPLQVSGKPEEDARRGLNRFERLVLAGDTAFVPGEGGVLVARFADGAWAWAGMHRPVVEGFDRIDEARTALPLHGGERIRQSSTLYVKVRCRTGGEPGGLVVRPQVHVERRLLRVSPGGDANWQRVFFKARRYLSVEGDFYGVSEKAGGTTVTLLTQAGMQDMTSVEIPLNKPSEIHHAIRVGTHTLLLYSDRDAKAIKLVSFNDAAVATDEEIHVGMGTPVAPPIQVWNRLLLLWKEKENELTGCWIEMEMA